MFNVITHWDFWDYSCILDSTGVLVCILHASCRRLLSHCAVSLHLCKCCHASDKGEEKNKDLLIIEVITHSLLGRGWDPLTVVLKVRQSYLSTWLALRIISQCQPHLQKLLQVELILNGAGTCIALEFHVTPVHHVWQVDPGLLTFLITDQTKPAMKANRSGIAQHLALSHATRARNGALWVCHVVGPSSISR